MSSSAPPGQNERKIKFRTATAEDYQEVMDINRNIYDGLDYLPALFMKYMRDTNYWFFVQEIDGEVVLFGGGLIMDKGRVMAIGARVKTTHVGTGIFADLTKSHRESLPQSQIFQTWVGATPNWGVFRKLWRRSGKDFAIRMVQNCYRLKLQSNTVTWNLPLISKPGVGTETVPKAELIPILENVDNQWRLFPSRLISLAGIAVNPVRSNIEILSSDSFKSVVSREITSDDATACQSISMAMTHAIPKGTKYSIDYFGNDLDDLYNHLVLHMQDIERLRVDGELYVYLLLPANFLIDDAKAMVLSKIPGLEIAIEPYPVYIIEIPWSQL